MLNHFPTTRPKADATLTLSKSVLERLQRKNLTVDQATASGDLRIQGKPGALVQLLARLDTFPTWFNIVTPNPDPS